MRRACLLLGLYAALAGALALAGWAFDAPRLTNWNGAISIQPNTAVAAIATGLALALLACERRRAPALAGGLTAAIGAATCFEHLTGAALGIDAWLLFDRPWGATATLTPGRMGPPGATAWTLAGLALVFQLGGARWRRATSALGLAVAAVACLSLTGYLFGASSLYALPRLTAIALPTSTILLAVGLGIVSAVPERQPLRGLLEESAAGLLTRRTLPFALGLPLTLAFLRLVGQDAGLYDTAFGTALLVLALTGVLCGLLWWGAASVRAHEGKLAAVAARAARAELAVREIREQFVVLDGDWRYVFVNDAVCELTGLAREQLLGQRAWELFPAARGTAFESALRRVAERRVPETFEFRFEPWGRWFENRAHPAPDGGVALLAIDLTERKSADAALRASEERFRSLVALITDVPWTTDAEGRFVSPQPAWSAYTGQPFEQHRGFGWADALHPEDRPAVRALWERACRTGTPYASSGRVWHAPTSEYRYFEARATPLRGDDGAVREWVGACTDVHDTKARELALEALALDRERLLAAAERAREEAQIASRAKDEFLAVLSHELRSPLNAMLGWVQILADEAPNDPLVRRAVSTLERNVRAQSQLIDDLLDISRITAGKLALVRRRVDLSTVVAGAVESMRPTARGKRVELGLDAGPGRLEIEGDPARLQQVAVNLIQNAVKFTPERGHVQVRLRRDGERAELVVEDDGQGIEPALLPSVFERFVQYESVSTRRHGGLGLGLSIVKHLVAAHRGAVRADSAGPGRGARFTVTLPLARGEEAGAEPAASHAAAGEARGAGTRAYETLLVEDDPDSREALTFGLERAGARVRAVGSVAEALAAYAERVPEVLVSDVAMPHENGYALIRAIRAREAEGPGRTYAIAITGFASSLDRETALSAGFDDHVPKPVGADTLVERIRALADGSPGPDSALSG